MIAATPAPPYYAVIFTSIRREDEGTDYAAAAVRMLELARQQPGFLGVESARSEVGITVSYWESLEAIRAWKYHAEHREAQHRGYIEWYRTYQTRICRVERAYGSELEPIF